MQRYRASQPQSHYSHTRTAGLDYHNFYIKNYLFQKYDPLLKFFTEWEQAVYSSSTRCPSTDLPPFPTMADLKTAIRGMKALCQLAIDCGNGIVPHRINQDVVESWFGHHRDACGSNRNMSGMSKITIAL